jgi:LTXXQ motif family protein
MKGLILAAVTIIALGATPGFAQAPVEDPHHPPAAGAPAPAPAQPAPPSGQAGPGGPQGMIGGMPMMMEMMRGMHQNMMRMMGTIGSGSAGMATIDRIEGRIAFLRTELKISDAQANAWNAFADALRTNAKRLGEVRASVMSRQGPGQPQAQTLADRLDAQERWLSARLEGTRAIRAVFTNLYGALSDDQKKTANDLLAPHMGVGMMAMTPGQTQPGQPQGMMPGQMMPRQMPQPGK